jgi:hypothetical protein
MGELAATLIEHPDGSGRSGLFLPWALMEIWGAPATTAVLEDGTIFLAQHGVTPGMGYTHGSRWPTAAKEAFFSWMAAQEFDLSRPHEAVSLLERRGFGFFYLRVRDSPKGA